MNYIDRARALGLDIAELKSGKVIHSESEITSVGEFKEIFTSELETGQRAAFSSNLDERPSPPFSAKS